jgi:two-component system cell cycle sensor histidine kinase/response regulator CckA
MQLPYENYVRGKSVEINQISAKVLIVEDNDIVSDCLQVILRTYGYDPIVAATPQQAVEQCQRDNIAIYALIADVRLGKASGFQTAQTLLRICPGMKVIFTSGYPHEHLVRSGLLPVELGTAVFLQKPFLASEILSSLRAFDEAPKARVHCHSGDAV